MVFVHLGDAPASAGVDGELSGELHVSLQTPALESETLHVHVEYRIDDVPVFSSAPYPIAISSLKPGRHETFPLSFRIHRGPSSFAAPLFGGDWLCHATSSNPDRHLPERPCTFGFAGTNDREDAIPLQALPGSKRRFGFPHAFQPGRWGATLTAGLVAVAACAPLIVAGVVDPGFVPVFVALLGVTIFVITCVWQIRRFRAGSRLGRVRLSVNRTDVCPGESLSVSCEIVSRARCRIDRIEAQLIGEQFIDLPTEDIDERTFHETTFRLTGSVVLDPGQAGDPLAADHLDLRRRRRGVRRGHGPHRPRLRPVEDPGRMDGGPTRYPRMRLASRTPFVGVDGARIRSKRSGWIAVAIDDEGFVQASFHTRFDELVAAYPPHFRRPTRRSRGSPRGRARRSG